MSKYIVVELIGIASVLLGLFLLWHWHRQNLERWEGIQTVWRTPAPAPLPRAFEDPSNREASYASYRKRRDRARIRPPIGDVPVPLDPPELDLPEWV